MGVCNEPQINHCPAEVSGSPSGQEEESDSPVAEPPAFSLTSGIQKHMGPLPVRAQNPCDPRLSMKIDAASAGEPQEDAALIMLLMIHIW